MSIPGGIRVKLSLALLLIVGGALLAAYAIVVPSLEQRLVTAKLDQLQSDADALAVNYATFVEFELLALLASNPGVVYSRRQLLERLRGGADYREPRTIDVHVRHLREKIEQEPREPELILTVRGAGYRFRDG